MFENSRYSGVIKNISKIYIVSLILMTVSAIIYIWTKYIDNIIISTDIKTFCFLLTAASVVLYILSLFMLFKKRKEPEAKNLFIFMIVGYFIIALMFYNSLN